VYSILRKTLRITVNS